MHCHPVIEVGVRRSGDAMLRHRCHFRWHEKTRSERRRVAKILTYGIVHACGH